jgi:hypothetical protein
MGKLRRDLEQQVVRLDLGDETRWAVRTPAGDAVLPVGLDQLLRLSLAEARSVVEEARRPRWAADITSKP